MPQLVSNKAEQMIAKGNDIAFFIIMFLFSVIDLTMQNNNTSVYTVWQWIGKNAMTGSVSERGMGAKKCAFLAECMRKNAIFAVY